MTRKARYVAIWPDDCECSASTRRTCSQGCFPKGGKIVKRASRKDKAVFRTFGRATKKYPLGKPLALHMTEARHAANAKAEAERAAAEKWHKISGLIFLHPCDMHQGMSVHWHRAGKILHGTVVSTNSENMIRPAKVLRRGPVRYHYTPSVYDYCDAEGNKPTTWRPPGIDCETHSNAAFARVTPYNVKPTKAQLAEARDWNKWAGERIPGGPVAGSLMRGTCLGVDDLDLALALVLRRVREGGMPT